MRIISGLGMLVGGFCAGASVMRHDGPPALMFFIFAVCCAIWNEHCE